jgi:small subunit ribosomal protein S1
MGNIEKEIDDKNIPGSFNRKCFLPPPDEAWWESVLNEEEDGSDSYRRYTNHHNKNNKIQFQIINSSFPAEKTDWEIASQLYQQDQLANLEVVGYNRGGLLVEGEKLQGFVPVSHLLNFRCEEKDIEKYLEKYIGRTLMLKVIECDQENNRVVFSERAGLSEPGMRNQLLNNLQTGDCVRGPVTNITSFGVFVDLGGMEGLVHVSELSWGRVQHPTEVVKIGEKVDAYVIQVDKDRSRIALSFKRLLPNPWENVQERYYPGQETTAVVTSIAPYGVFARLEEGLDGLIHISEMGDVEFSGEELENLVDIGQYINVKVLHIDTKKQRLGLRLLLEDDR